MAVVGSGPAAFYAAAPLLVSEDPVVEVDMIERLPTPWGLVRLGVAPDHPQLKSVSRAFEKIAVRPGFRFLGNVDVGRDVTHEELTSAYDAVIYAVGSQTDRKLGIPGEDLPGSWAATELVAWYNGHPDFQHLDFDLSHERAVVIGNGNVALDVARMLALTEEELAPTDTTDAAIDAIVSSGIREIVVLGRRGPVQAAWTSTELGELGELAGADVVVDACRARARCGERAELEAGSNIVQRNVEILREFATHRSVRQASGRAPSVPRLPGRRSSETSTSRVSRSSTTASSRTSAVRCVRSRPTSARSFRAGSSFAASATAVSGFPESRSTRARGGSRTTRVACSARTEARSRASYCAGWIKRGPTGVIGTNKKDATETVEHLLEDARVRPTSRAHDGRDASNELLVERGADVVAYAGWEAIDAAERTHGDEQGRPRVKLCSWDELLAAARSG